MHAASATRNARPRPAAAAQVARARRPRSEEHTSELQSQSNLVCRLLLEKKNRHRTGELLEEVLDTARAAAEVVEHHLAHNDPAQARAPAQGGLCVVGDADALGN